MKKVLFGLSLVAATFAASAQDVTAAAVHCMDFSAAGYCDAMQFDSGLKATWHSYDCAGSQGKQTKALYFTGKTVCDGTKGCNPAAAYGWDSLNWVFNKTASTGTLTGTTGGQTYVLQQDMPVYITSGACAVELKAGGVSSMAR